MKKTTILIGGLVLAALVAVVAVGIALTRDTTEPAHTDSHTHIADPRVSDPTIAATGTMTALLTWEPAQQSGPWESAAAVEDRLTGRLAEYAASQGADEPLPGDWQTWAEGGDRIQGIAAVSPDTREIPADATTATVTVDVEQRVWHPSGDMTPLTKGVVDVTVELIDGEWKTSNYSYLSIDY